MNLRIKFFLFAIFSLNLVLLAPFATCAQGPKVGVVLSGGGAKGYAHVGVLKVLEDAGVRVDYIGGTSMGAIIGGLYASGWPATSLDSILRSIDVSVLLQDRLPRDTRSFLEKEYGEHYAFTLSLPGFQVQAPDAFSAGQMVYDYFSRLTIPVHHIRHFDSLPVPYLCIATDVETGRQVVLRDGFLPDAMRTSGSLPVLLAPMWREGRMLLDGGAVNNFPAKEVREMGADILIGVTVEGDPYTGEDLEQLDKMLSHIAYYRLYENSEKQYKECDLLLRPELGKFSLTSFTEIDTLIKVGEAAALSVWDSLVAIARQQNGGTAQPLRKPVPVLPDSVAIGKVYLGDSAFFTSAYLLSRFESPLPGKLAYDQFFHGIQRMKGTRHLKFIQYRFDGEGPEKDLWLYPYPENGYDKKLKVGVHYDDVYRASFLLNATFEHALHQNGFASLDLILLDRFRYFFHYLIDNGLKPSYGFKSRLHFNDFSYRLPEPVALDSALMLEQIMVDYTDFSNQIYLRLLTGNSRSAGLGAEFKYFRARSEQLSGDQARGAFILEDAFYFTGLAYWKSDRLDDRWFPTRGSRWDVSGKAIYPLSSLNEDRALYEWGLMADINWEAAFSLGSRWALCPEVQLGWTWGQAQAPYLFFLGGYNHNLINHFKPFVGLPFAAEGGSRLVSGQLRLRYQPWHNHYLSLGASLAFLDDYLHDRPDEFRHFFSGFVRYSFRSPIGPLELTQAFSNGRRGQFYVNLGYWF